MKFHGDLAPGPAEESETVLAATRRWLEKSVIGLDLCPFASAVYRADRVRLRVSDHGTPSGVLEDLRAELRLLADADPMRIETTLLIHPRALHDFLEYNEFLADCESMIGSMDLEGQLQIASFHPRYQFAGTDPQDIENYSNRSPYPLLHLLREGSVERAVAGLSDPAEIYRKNIDTLRRLGHEGWRRLWKEPL